MRVSSTVTAPRRSGGIPLLGLKSRSFLPDVPVIVAVASTLEASYIIGQNLAVDGGWTIGHLPQPRS